MTSRRTALDLLVIGVGGAVGALLRWGSTEAAPDGAGFPWTTFAINVIGCLALALLPHVVAVRRGVLFWGTGVLGGFTTMSAASDQTRALLADGDTTTALAYLLGTLAVAIIAVNVAAMAGRREQ